MSVINALRSCHTRVFLKSRKFIRFFILSKNLFSYFVSSFEILQQFLIQVKSLLFAVLKMTR